MTRASPDALFPADERFIRRRCLDLVRGGDTFCIAQAYRDFAAEDPANHRERLDLLSLAICGYRLPEDQVIPFCRQALRFLNGEAVDA